MENNVLLIDQFTGRGFDHYFGRRMVGDDGCRRLAVAPPPPRRSIYGSFTFAPFQYTTYEAASLYSSLSLPVHLPYSHHTAAPTPTPATLFPYLPSPAVLTKYSTFPYGPSLPPLPSSSAVTGIKSSTSAAAAAMVRSRMGDCKRKKPRTPRSGEEQARAQRRRPLERAAPLPPAPAVAEALDDLEREVTRGFVEDLLHALAPPPSSLPLPTFSLVRSAAAKAAASCAV
uniref:Uncharacterized protein n=1 Tax=Oryza punctata TaxID=4537 RepID=A0A0E0M5E4_ORYPU